MLNQVCVLTIKVKDMEEGVDFYTNILDFKVAQRYGDTIIRLEHNGVPLILEKAAKQDTTTSTKVLLGIQSQNIQGDFQRLQEKGVSILSSKPLPCPPGFYFVIEDYSGNQLEIVEYVDQEMEE
jgi:lactoylglutathione lyase